MKNYGKHDGGKKYIYIFFILPVSAACCYNYVSLQLLVSFMNIFVLICVSTVPGKRLLQHNIVFDHTLQPREVLFHHPSWLM